MLVLTRNVGEGIVISVDGKIVAEVEVTRVTGNRVRLGVTADRSVQIDRQEIYALKRQAAPTEEAAAV